MQKRFVLIWFRYLTTDWLTIRRPALQNMPFVFATPDRGRMIITAISPVAAEHAIAPGMAVADARALVPTLQVFDEQPLLAERLLKALALWCIRYTPVTAIDNTAGVVLDASGCAHLWGGEEYYITDIDNRLKKSGYNIKIAMADTIGTAWAMAHFAQEKNIVASGEQANALHRLPAAALRLSADTIVRLQKLGLYQAGSFIHMRRSALRRRFGEELLLKIDQALGYREEIIQPVSVPAVYQERLSCPDPITTATGIEIALKRLLGQLCERMLKEEKGLRTAVFKYFRLDGKSGELQIGTNHPSQHASHLFKLFEPKLDTIEPGLGIELFVLEGLKVEDATAAQQKLWTGSCGVEDNALSELLDRLANRFGADRIHRYLPAEHYWPERSIKPAVSLAEKPVTDWQAHRLRPVQLLAKPQPIEVSAPVPDYPPMLFRYKGQLHTIKKADGPERIEREWWLEEGPHRDYYQVEDEHGRRYWLFRSGHYSVDKTHQWFIHGFFP